jgi:AraC-like DNA-binding protein
VVLARLEEDAVTALSPLQFQKRMRLQEARHLMLAEDLDAASAGFRVGYSDASQFTREYKRLFGSPPMRDVERLRRSACPTRHRRVSTVLSGRSSSNQAMSPFFP